MQSGGAAPIKLFYSYSHRDEELRNELAEHLFPLQRAGLIEVWHDREIALASACPYQAEFALAHARLRAQSG